MPLLSVVVTDSATPILSPTSETFEIEETEWEDKEEGWDEKKERDWQENQEEGRLKELDREEQEEKHKGIGYQKIIS